MKETFISKALNNPFLDPVVLVRFIREKRSILFDAGDITSLSVKMLLNVSHVFISHMHIDHFIGFDQILRYSLRREKPLFIYGPEGIINAVEGKLKGYTWNLIKEYPLKVEVFEIKEKVKNHAHFYAQEAFARIDQESELSDSVILVEPEFSVKAFIFNHQIPVLGFSIVEDVHININKARLIERGFPVGPWLKDFKRAVKMEKDDEKFWVNGTAYTCKELEDLVIITKGQKITYITDISMDEENLDKAIALAQGSDILYIEAYFLERDRERALKRNHLTTKEAGIIARKAAVERFHVIHVSPKYISLHDEVISEVMEEFKKNTDSRDQ
jgi:ribonuclease Z